VLGLEETLRRLFYFYARVLAVPVFLLGTATALKAQNALSLSPGTVFLNGVVGGPAVQQTFAVTSSPVAAVPFTATFGNAAWLTISPTSGTTPATLTLTANPVGLTAGVYSTIIALSSASASTVPLVVVFTVNNPTTLTSSPGTAVFAYTAGGTTPTPQTLTISNTAGATPTFSVSPVNAGWLLLGQSGNSITVGINPTPLAPGQVYVGGILISPTNGQPGLLVSVVLYYYPSPQVTVTPNALNFNYQIGAVSNTVQKSLSVSPASSTFTATASVPAGTPQWLTVSPASGMGAATVSVVPAGLPAGTYQGSVSISVAGSNAVTVPVTLTVSALPLVDVNPSSLNYSYQVGTANPPDQAIMITSTTPGLPFSAAAVSQGNWLTVNVVNALTPNQVTASVNPAGLPAGTYTGTISFNAVGAANNPQTVNITLTVTNNPTFTANPNPLVFNYEIGQAVPGAQTVAVTSGGTPVSFTITSNGNANNVNWLLTGPPTATTTPANFTVGVSPTGLPAGIYNGTIVLSSPGGSTQLSIPVTLNVSNAGQALLNLPTSFSFSSVLGNSSGPSQVVNVTSTGEPVTYTVAGSTSTPAGSNWLVVGAVSGPASAATPSTFIVGVNPAGLGAGTYKGSLLFHATNGIPDVTVPVTYTITSGNLAVTPATLNFTQASGAPAPAAQNVNVTSTGVQLTFSALATVSTTTNWLSVSPTSGVTPGTVAVSVNAGSLQPGNYTGTVSIASSAAGNSPQSVTVNLTVGLAQNLSLSPTSLTFSSQVSAPAPATQTIGVTLSNGSLPFTAAVSTGSGSSGWLVVSPASGTAGQTATNLTVSVNPQGLNAGTYNGTVTVSAQGAGNSPQTVNVTYTVTAIPTPTVTFVRNAGSGAIMPIAPGEIISIFGTNLGPATPVTTNTSQDFPGTLSDTQVLFDNIPGAMWYTSATQINVIVPYEIAGRTSSQMQVVYKNTTSSSLNLQVAVAAPGMFLTTGGQVSAYNQDGTVNGAAHPVPKGMALQIFATGEGATNPAGVTGKIIPADGSVLKSPLAPVSVTIGGQQVTPFYAGSAPGLVSGALQVNVYVPDTAPSGPAVPIVLTIGGISSQGTATVAIQ
jgi:uncharacterized protein (TIGR03437 family)